jgi:hypothetical protein
VQGGDERFYIERSCIESSCIGHRGIVAGEIFFVKGLAFYWNNVTISYYEKALKGNNYLFALYYMFVM